jgi:GT2 family glycosyltransferase
MFNSTSICIGIVTKNRCQYLIDCIESIFLQQKLPTEVIIFNDGSTDQTEVVLKSKEKQFLKTNIKYTYLSSDKSKAQPYGRNQILTSSTSDIIAYVDDDVICTRSWLKKLGESYRNEFVAGVGGPAIRVDHDMKPIWQEINTPRNINTLNKYGELRDYSDNWVPPHSVETHVLRGANMSFRRDVLIRVGGFDEKYFGRAFMEDVDPQIKIRNMGYKLMYNPKVLVLHRAVQTGGANLGNKKDDWYSIGYTNAYFIKKHFKNNYLKTLLRLPFRTRYSPIPLIRILFECLQQRSEDPLWTLKGYFDGFRN